MPFSQRMKWQRHLRWNRFTVGCNSITSFWMKASTSSAITHNCPSGSKYPYWQQADLDGNTLARKLGGIVVSFGVLVSPSLYHQPVVCQRFWSEGEHYQKTLFAACPWIARLVHAASSQAQGGNLYSTKDRDQGVLSIVQDPNLLVSLVANEELGPTGELRRPKPQRPTKARSAQVTFLCSCESAAIIPLFLKVPTLTLVRPAWKTW